MKRILLVSFLFTATLFSGRALAQSVSIQAAPAEPKKDSTIPKIEFGLKLGANFQSISGNTWNNSYKPGVVAGITLGMHKKKVGVRVEVLVGLSNYTSVIIRDSSGEKAEFRATYINIPVLFEYSFIPMLKLQAGPQYSNMISVKAVQGFDGDPKVLFKQSELSGVLGLEAKLPAHFSVGARYILGLSNINNNVYTTSASDSWKNSTAQVYVGYSIQ